MATIRCQTPGCGKLLRVTDGKRLKCPGCGQRLEAPSSQGPTSARTRPAARPAPAAACSADAAETSPAPEPLPIGADTMVAPSRASAGFWLQHILFVDFSLMGALAVVLCAAGLFYAAVAWLDFPQYEALTVACCIPPGVVWAVRRLWFDGGYPQRWIAFRVRRRLPSDANEWELEPFPDPKGARVWTDNPSLEGTELSSTANDLPYGLRREHMKGGAFELLLFLLAVLLFVGLAVLASHYLARWTAALVAAGLAGGYLAVYLLCAGSKRKVLRQALTESMEPLCQEAVTVMDRRFRGRVVEKRAAEENRKAAKHCALIMPKEEYDRLERPEVCAQCGSEIFVDLTIGTVVMTSSYTSDPGIQSATTTVPLCSWCEDWCEVSLGVMRGYYIKCADGIKDVITGLHPRFIDAFLRLNAGKGCARGAVIDPEAYRPTIRFLGRGREEVASLMGKPE